VSVNAEEKKSQGTTVQPATDLLLEARSLSGFNFQSLITGLFGQSASEEVG
jgi:hypothetical protein